MPEIKGRVAALRSCEHTQGIHLWAERIEPRPKLQRRRGNLCGDPIGSGDLGIAGIVGRRFRNAQFQLPTPRKDRRTWNKGPENGNRKAAKKQIR
jgi:hypothetical protein